MGPVLLGGTDGQEHGRAIGEEVSIFRPRQLAHVGTVFAHTALNTSLGNFDRRLEFITLASRLSIVPSDLPDSKRCIAT